MSPTEAIWAVRAVAPDVYEFEFLPVGAGAGEVEIVALTDGAVTIPQDQPLAVHNTFQQRLVPGSYVLGWHWTHGCPDIRAYAAFDLPFPGRITTLAVAPTAREVLGLAAIAHRYQVIGNIAANVDTYERPGRRVRVEFGA